MTLGQDYATRIREAADRIAALGVDRRDPHRFFETKDTVNRELMSLADQVELDQVFAGREAPAPSRSVFPSDRRTVRDSKGRCVAVETRRGARSSGVARASGTN